MTTTPNLERELEKELLELWESMFGNNVKATAGSYVADYKDFLKAGKALITQHTDRAEVERAIGDNDFEGCASFDEFGYHGKDCDRPGGCIERQNRDELRAEIRTKLRGEKS